MFRVKQRIEDALPPKLSGAFARLIWKMGVPTDQQIAQNYYLPFQAELVAGDKHRDPTAIKKGVEKMVSSPKQSRTNKAVLMAYNIVMGTGEIIDIPVATGEKELTPALSLFSLIAHLITGENGVRISSSIVTGQPLKQPRINYDSTARANTHSTQYAINPFFADVTTPGTNEEALAQRVLPMLFPVDIFIKAARLLNNLTAKVPESLSSALEDFIVDNNIERSQKLEVCLSVLQILHQLDLIKDMRFQSLAHELRHIMLETAPQGYESLKNYHYTVFDRELFWVEGILETGGLPGVQDNNRDHQDYENQKTNLFPSLVDWDAQIKKIAILTRKIDQASTPTVIRQEIMPVGLQSERAVNKALDLIAQRVVDKAARKRIKRLLITKYEDIFDRHLHTLPKNENDELRSDVNFNYQIIKTIADSAQNSPKLSTRSQQKLAIYSSVSPEQSDRLAYPLNIKKIFAHPLLDWVFTLHNTEARKKLLRAVDHQPHETVVLHRLMVQGLITKSTHRQEYPYVLNPSHKIFTDDYAIARQFFYDLVHLFESRVPTQAEVIKESLAQGLAVDNLITPAEIKKTLKRLHYWQHYPLIKLGKYSQDLSYIWGIDDKSINTWKSALLFVSAVSGAVGACLVPLLLAQSLSNAHERSEEKHNSDYWINQNHARDFREYFYLEEKTTRVFAELLHYPDSLMSLSSETKLYITTEIKDYPYGENINQLRKDLDFSLLDDKYLSFTPRHDQIVYKPTQVARVMYPPLGFKIIGIFKSNGDTPQVTLTGEIVWDKDQQLPYDIIIVAEPLHIDDSHNLKYAFMLKNVRRDSYIPTFDHKQALQYNHRLHSEPELQALQLNFINEMYDFTMRPYSLEQLDNVILKYAELYLEWVRAKREYRVRRDNLDPVVGQTLIDIARNPNWKYDCLWASFSLRDFMLPVDVHATVDMGFPVYPSDNQLLTNDGHSINRIFLPSGRVAYIDTTPQGGLATMAFADSTILSPGELAFPDSPPTTELPREEVSRDESNKVAPTPSTDGTAPTDLTFDFMEEEKDNFLDEGKKRVEELARTYDVPAIVVVSFLVAIKITQTYLSKRSRRKKIRRMLEELNKSSEIAGREQTLLTTLSVVISCVREDDLLSYAEKISNVLEEFVSMVESDYDTLCYWINGSFGYDPIVYSNLENLINNSMNEKDEQKILADIKTGWYSNQNNIRIVVPPKMAPVIENAIHNAISQNTPLANIDPRLLTALKWGLHLKNLDVNTSVMDILKKLGSIVETDPRRKTTPIADEMGYTRNRQKIIVKVIEKMLLDSRVSPKSQKYLRYLHKLFNYP